MMQCLGVPWRQPPNGTSLPGIRAQNKELGIIGRNAHEKDHEDKKDQNENILAGEDTE